MLMFAEIAQAWLAAPSRLIRAALSCITAAQKMLPCFCVSVAAENFTFKSSQLLGRSWQ